MNKYFFETETLVWTLNRWVPIEVHYMEKILECFIKNRNFFSTEERKILDYVGVNDQ